MPCAWLGIVNFGRLKVALWSLVGDKKASYSLMLFQAKVGVECSVNDSQFISNFYLFRWKNE